MRGMNMENLNAKCSICGKPYHVCHSCLEQKSFKPWRVITDTVEHYKIYLVIHDYTNKTITKNEAKIELEKCNLSNLETFVPEIKSVITDIIKEDKKSSTKKNVSKKEMDIESDISDIE
jgi:hypothetical protein